jgi:hypothetical protein
MRPARLVGDGYWILGTLLVLIAAVSTSVIISCGSGGGSSNGGLCEQCGVTPDGPCQASVVVEPGSDVPACDQAGQVPPCTVALHCFRKLGSAQRRCFPEHDVQFRCDGARANRSTPVLTPTPTPTATPKRVAFAIASNGSVVTTTVQVTATYPTTKGDFGGAVVVCTANASGTLAADDADGTLTVTLTGTADLAFPITITCDFDQATGETLSASDVQASINQAGLSVSVTVT